MVLHILRERDVRLRLRRDLLWILGAAGVLVAGQLVASQGFGWDAHAYWLGARGEMYTRAPGVPDAYLYSPAFAQALWPLAQLPWPAFAAVMSLMSAGLLAWLLSPLGLARSLAIFLVAMPEIVSGNIFAALAAAAVLGFRHPSVWSVAALTKVTPCLGPIWWVIQGKWLMVLKAVSSIAAIVGISYATSPVEWHAWTAFLMTHLQATTGPVGSSLVPPPMVRIPLALAVLAWGARTQRTWVIPVAMVLATPVFGVSALTMLAAIPRLRNHQTQTTEPGMHDSNGDQGPAEQSCEYEDPRPSLLVRQDGELEDPAQSSALE